MFSIRSRNRVSKKCLKIFPVFKSCLETVFPLSLLWLILRDPGADSGGGEKSKRARKKFGPRKSRNERRAPWDKRFRTAQFQTVGEVLASGWCEKSFVFLSAQSQSSKTRSRFVCSYTKDTYRPVDRHFCLGRSPRVYSRRKVSIHSTKCREDRPGYPRETRRKYAGPFAGILTLAPVAKASSLAPLHQS